MPPKAGVKISASYAASSALARQIEQGRRRISSSPPIPTGWTTPPQKKTINESTRVNLLGNKIVLIAPKDSKIADVSIGQGFDLAKLAGDGRIATGDVQSVPVGNPRQGRARKARLVGGRVVEICDGRKACAPR